MSQLKDIKGVGNATIEKLKKLGINNVFELLSYFPSKYIDLKHPVSPFNAEAGEYCLLEGKIISKTEPSKRGNKSFTLTLEDTVGEKRDKFKLYFYNQPYLCGNFNVGSVYRILTKKSYDTGPFNFINPICEDKKHIELLEGVYTTYPLKGLLGQKVFKKIVLTALTAASMPDYGDNTLAGKKDTAGYVPNGAGEIYCKYLVNFKKIHSPSSVDDAEEAINNLAAIDLAISIAAHKKSVEQSKNLKLLYKTDKNIILSFKSALPYSLTSSQNSACEDIVEDLTSNKDSSRILIGDVGSGKTAVGFFALYFAYCCGYQCAYIAPTEILIKQHFEKFAQIAEKFAITCELLTGNTSKSDKERICENIKSGTVSVLFGTQSILNENLIFKNLSLAVIDEQHKFGVKERAMLEKKGAEYILSMSATPIPRSLALAFYDNLKVSEIEKRPETLLNIITKTVSDEKTLSMMKYIAEECKNGVQSFIVCPTIKDNDGYDAYSLELLLKSYAGIFDGVEYAVLHGKIRANEKDEIMTKFKNGAIKLLFATSVIEVGIDTKAQNIVIMNSERFGLASLHQLRGRIGRDGSRAQCFLHVKSVSPKSVERIKFLCKATNGLEVAEYDFDNRGSGDFIGARQSGVALTPIFGLPIDYDTLVRAKRLADKFAAYSLFDLIKATHGGEDKLNRFIENIRNATLNS